MSRSPLFYPMHRGDSDAGGAADLQTDVMRFMAILALCLVAIFALVQSIPLVPEAPTQSPAPAAPPPTTEAVEADPEPPVRNKDPVQPEAEPEKVVQLTRPKWTSTFVPERDTTEPVLAPDSETAPQADTPADPSRQGFTLRFESDLALTRLVAAGKVGLYAIAGGRARRRALGRGRSLAAGPPSDGQRRSTRRGGAPPDRLRGDYGERYANPRHRRGWRAGGRTARRGWASGRRARDREG